MNDLVPRLGGALDALRGEHSTGRIPRDVMRAVQREQGAALVRSTRVEGRAYVARAALVNTALLSAEEANLIQMAPLAEPRLRAIVDSYALWAASEVGRS